MSNLKATSPGYSVVRLLSLSSRSLSSPHRCQKTQLESRFLPCYGVTVVVPWVSADAMGKPVGTWCLLALLFTACIMPAAATDATIKGNVFITDTANFVNVSSIIAGEALVIDFLLTDQATNATLGNILGFCVALRSNGPSQCQYTVQLAPGTLQASNTQHTQHTQQHSRNRLQSKATGVCNHLGSLDLAMRSMNELEHDIKHMCRWQALSRFLLSQITFPLLLGF